jgi:hypothetical protein
MPQRTLFLIFFIFSLHSWAATHCVCEIGQNKNEKAFYKLGCNTWLNNRKCDSRRVLDRKNGFSLSAHLQELRQGDVLELGFVGHWLNFYQTINYISDQVVPLVQKRRIDVNYDNTACSPMDDPEGVQEYLMDLKLPAQNHIMIKGSQGISIGMWDVLFIGQANFYAYAHSDWTTPKFLPCKNIEGKVCSASFQKGETGRCYDRLQKKLVWLSCQQPEKKHAYEWLRAKYPTFAGN